jgi:hypothetical protein
MNPEAFPIIRIQVVQALYFPSADVIRMWTHQNVNGDVVQVTADMKDGPVNHFIIKDPHIITALGLQEDTKVSFRFFKVTLESMRYSQFEFLPKQRVHHVIGELRSARHAYLYWLDGRRDANPRRAPYAQEARKIATYLR